MKISFGAFLNFLFISAVCIGVLNGRKQSGNHDKTSAKKPPAVSAGNASRAPRSRSAQQYFLVTPEDFSKDDDVDYLVKQLSRPQVIEKFYSVAQEMYNTLPVMYKELQGDAALAEKFLDIIKRLSTASFNEPLTVTNIIFAIGKHLRVLFKTKAAPLDEMGRIIAELEVDPKRIKIRVMNQFFMNFTLREMYLIQNFINLMSLAELTENGQSTLNISKTSLFSYAEYIRLTIANSVAKMLILLDLFVNDPTAMPRSIALINRLWSLHLRRLAAREGVPIENLDQRWLNPSLYRKSAITFSFEDWAPNTVSPETLNDLKLMATEAQKMEAARAASLNDSACHASFTKIFVFTGLAVVLIAAVAYFSYYRLLLPFMAARNRARATQIDLSAIESQSFDDGGIVETLERNVAAIEDD